MIEEQHLNLIKKQPNLIYVSLSNQIKIFFKELGQTKIESGQKKQQVFIKFLIQMKISKQDVTLVKQKEKYKKDWKNMKGI